MGSAGEEGSLSGINLGATGGAGAILKSMAAKGKEKEDKAKAASAAEPSPPIASTSKAPAASSSTAAVEPWNASKSSTGHLAASLTSTAAPVFTKTERALYDMDELMFDAIKEKGYVKLKTNFGDMNLELFCDKVCRPLLSIMQWLTYAHDRLRERAITL